MSARSKIVRDFSGQEVAIPYDPRDDAQHTPGPWTVGSGDAQGPNGVFVGEGDNRKAVAMLTGTFVPRNGYAVDEGDDGWPHERTANAALIAAASETAAERDRLRESNEVMLKALGGFVEYFADDEDELGEIYANAKAALAAAERAR